MKLMQWIGKQCKETNCAEPEFEQTYDVIVVGLGTAGAIAALSAAKLGLNVLGLERMNGMGGTGTFGGVTSYYLGSTGGLFERIDELVKETERLGYLRAGGVNAEVKKLVLEQEAVRAGVSVRYEADVIGVYRNMRRIAGVRWAADGGLHEAGCRVLIDCTGDAAIAAMAGCETRIGRDSDGTLHAYSSVVSLLDKQAVRTFYTDSGYVDPTDVRELTRELLHSATLPTHLKESYDDQPLLLKSAPLLGVREGRFIVGEQTVRFDDFVRGDLPGEPLFYAYANLDNHGKDMALESELQQDWTVAAGLWETRFAVPVPLGALVPRSADNMLVAGRCISLDHDVASCVRMKRDMQKCGEIAAAAAYWAIRLNANVIDVPIERIMSVLRTTGCDRSPDSAARWLTDIGEIGQGLASERPGIAIWSARLIGEAAVPHLLQWCAQDRSEHLRKHSAFALALLGNEAALPALRGMAAERDDFMPQTGSMYNQLRGYAAAYLLGKLRDAASVPLLLQIADESAQARPEPGADGSIQAPAQPPEPAIEQDEARIPARAADIHIPEQWVKEKFVVSEDDYRFQYLSYALMALLSIGDSHPEQRGPIAGFIRSRVLTARFAAHITLNSPPHYRMKYPVAQRLHKIASERLAAW